MKLTEAMTPTGIPQSTYVPYMGTFYWMTTRTLCQHAYFFRPAALLGALAQGRWQPRRKPIFGDIGAPKPEQVPCGLRNFLQFLDSKDSVKKVPTVANCKSITS